jgi:hypothetical protein
METKTALEHAAIVPEERRVCIRFIDDCDVGPRRRAGDEITLPLRLMYELASRANFEVLGPDGHAVEHSAALMPMNLGAALKTFADRQCELERAEYLGKPGTTVFDDAAIACRSRALGRAAQRGQVIGLAALVAWSVDTCRIVSSEELAVARVLKLPGLPDTINVAGVRLYHVTIARTIAPGVLYPGKQDQRGLEAPLPARRYGDWRHTDPLLRVLGARDLLALCDDADLAAAVFQQHHPEISRRHDLAARAQQAMCADILVRCAADELGIFGWERKAVVAEPVRLSTAALSRARCSSTAGVWTIDNSRFEDLQVRDLSDPPVRANERRASEPAAGATAAEAEGNVSRPAFDRWYAARAAAVRAAGKIPTGDEDLAAAATFFAPKHFPRDWLRAARSGAGIKAKRGRKPGHGNSAKNNSATK